jgi:hypothetical protein
MFRSSVASGKAAAPNCWSLTLRGAPTAAAISAASEIDKIRNQRYTYSYWWKQSPAPAGPGEEKPRMFESGVDHNHRASQKEEIFLLFSAITF